MLDLRAVRERLALCGTLESIGDCQAMIAEIESLREDLSSRQAAIDAAWEALEGDGVMCDLGAVADELRPYRQQRKVEAQ